MNKVLVKDSTLTNIAEAIRKKYNSYFQMLPSEMPDCIEDIDTEKVTIDDYRVTEEMNLYSFQNQVVLDIEKPPTTAPSEYTYQGKLYDGSKLYMKTTITGVMGGSSNSSAGCTGTVLLIKPNGTQLSVAIPTYTIPSRSETGSSSDSCVYHCELYFSPDGNVYLRLQRIFIGSNYETYYESIYKLNISSSSLSWTNKVIEATFGPGVYVDSDYIIENNYIYAAATLSSSRHTRYIYGYKYGDTSYKFQRISTNGISQNFISSNSTVFIRKNTNTYIYFWGPDSDSTLCDKWISITRNSDGTYTENKGTASLSKYHKYWKAFMLNDEAYIWMLGWSDNGGFHIYKLNSDNSAWEVVYNIANVNAGNTRVTTYLNNAPDTIFQGKSFTQSIRNDGTFDLLEFIPGTLYLSQVPTPTITTRGDYETWYYLSYRCNDIGQKIFFFQAITDDGYYYYSRYKCVIQAMDDSPVLYSTFRESDIMGSTIII